MLFTNYFLILFSFVYKHNHQKRQRERPRNDQWSIIWPQHALHSDFPNARAFPVDVGPHISKYQTWISRGSRRTVSALHCKLSCYGHYWLDRWNGLWYVDLDKTRRLIFMFIFICRSCFRITFFVIFSTSNTKGDDYPYFNGDISRK